MDEEEYEEAFEEYAPRSNRWLWILFTLAVIAAVVFAILWYLRGGELARQTAAMHSAQTAADSTAQRLQQDADDARSAADANAARIAELENTLRAEQRNAAGASSQTATLQAALAEAETVRGQLAEAQETIAGLESTISGLETGRNDASRELTAANEALRQLETKYAAAQKELAEEKSRVAGIAAAAGTGAGAVGEEIRNRLDQMEKRAVDAENAVAEVKKQAEQASSGLNARLAEAGRNAATLEKKIADLEANRAGLTRDLAAAADKARQATAARDELRNAVREARNQAEKAEQTLKNREKELLDDFEQQRNEWQKRIEEAIGRDSGQQGQTRADETKSADTEQPAAAASAEPAPAAPAPATPAAPATATAAAPAASASGQWTYVELDKDAASAVKAPRHVRIGDPGRAVGRVVQVLTDGTTFVVSGGSNQRVKSGMVYDVHRRSGEMNRYIGLLLVTRVLDDFSLAVPVQPTREARVCPVTGRVVLDPAGSASPYVEAEGGKPVPLIPASSLGLGREMPRIGDCIDNPYYNPRRAVIFSAEAGLERDPRVLESIEGFGGVMGGAAASPDFEVVRVLDPGTAPSARLRQTTVDMLVMYYAKPVEPAAASAAKK